MLKKNWKKLEKLIKVGRRRRKKKIEKFFKALAYAS